jgi:hypothetical protein
MTERGLREVEPGGGTRLSAGVGHCGDEPEVSEIEVQRTRVRSVETHETPSWEG